MFGSTRPTFSGTTNFSGFGSTNQQSTGFGTGGSAFGRAPFGSQPTSSGFGIASTSTPFGGTTNTGSSLFGTAGQTGNTGNSGLFGSQVPGAFSANKPTGFTTATSNTGTSLFGTQNTAGTASTGLFGSSTTNSSNAFGTQNKPFGFATPTSNTTGGGLFNTSSSGGLFGANTGTSNVVGTTVKYQPVTGSDTMTRNAITTNIQTRIEVITCMKEYESKSLEELRVEDYLANRKGPGQGGNLMTGAFGQNTGTTGGLFGATNSNTGLFGQKPAENKPLFGAPNTGFAAVSSSGGGLFGSTNTAAPAFGQAAGTSSSTGGFSFGQNTQQNKSGGFSFMPNNNATSGGGLFGQQQQQQSNTGFGATNTGFSFGQNATSQQSGGLFNQAKPAFGATTSTSGGLFGSKPATTLAFGGLGTQGFGTTSTASPFGTSTSTSGGLFGNTQNKPAFGLGSSSAFGTGTAFNTGTNTGGGGLFGNLNTNTSGGLFSNTANQNKPAGGLAFNPGTTFNSGSNSLGFGFNNNANKPTGFGALGGGFGTGGTLSLGGNATGNNIAATAGIGDNNIANLIKALTDNPFGHSSLLKTPATTTGKADELLSPPSSNANKHTSSSLGAPTYVLPSNNASGPQPRANTSLGDSGNLMNNRNLLFAGLDDTNESNGGDEIFKTKTFPSVKKLNLKVFNSGKNGLSSLSGTMGGSRPSTPSVAGIERGQSPLTSPLHLPASPHLADLSATPDIIKGRNNIKKLSIASKKPMVGFNDTIADLNVGARTNGNQNTNYGNTSLNGEVCNTSTAANASNANYTIYEASSQDFSDHDIPEVNAPPHPTGIKLSRAGYYTIPSMSELANLVDEDGRCIVENFSVGREGYGNVCFTSDTDVMGLDLDSIVFIVRKEIEVYPDGTNKPKVGEELNKPAVITLDAVWPIDKSSRVVIKDADRLDAMGWPQYLEKKCLSMGAKFLEYRPDTGSWVFKVSHFSKYGLEDDGDELCVEELLEAQQQHLAKQRQQQQAQQHQHQAQQQQQGPALDAYPRKTSDASLIKSAAGKAYSVAGSSSVAFNSDGGEAESTSVTPATTSSSGSLSTSSSGLGGGSSPTTNGGGPPTQGLLSPPPIHHLLPGARRLRDSPSHLQQQQQQNLPSSSASSMLRSTAAAAAAPVPGEMFLDSFANEPHESASLGLSYPLPGGSGVNLALQQLTANLFPMEEDDNGTDGDGYVSGTVLHGTTMDPSMMVDSVTTKRSAGMEAREVTESSAKKFAGRRLNLSSSVVGQDTAAAAAGVASQEGRLSPSAGERTLLRPKVTQHPVVSQQTDSGVAESHHRGPRSEYPVLPSGGGESEYPLKVAPQHSSALVPLSSSIIEGQHKNLCDHAAYMGRRSRVGWGPSFRLLHTGQPLSTQVDVVAAAASAREKRLKRDANAQKAALPYLFLAPTGAATTTPLHSLPDMPEYNVRIEKLHLTDLSAASGCLPDPNTALLQLPPQHDSYNCHHDMTATTATTTAVTHPADEEQTAAAAEGPARGMTCWGRAAASGAQQDGL
ncbi:Peptidase S59 nucleoporin [Trinorchestia longiramus]|nr:Peptidase S59 nucleoporin [Trinorchestia longiramus]